MKMAVVGSGISGLVAARGSIARGLVSPDDLTVFEADRRIGGHTHTREVERPDGSSIAIDTGFIVFNDRHYPEFSRLLAELGVASHQTDMSFSVRCDKTGLEYNGTNANTIFAQRRNLFRPSFHRFLWDIVRFNRELKGGIEALPDDLTVGEYLSRSRFSRAFGDRYLVPLAASLWSSPPQEVERFSVRFVAEFLANHNMLDAFGRPTWRVVTGGSKQYLGPISETFRHRIRRETPVRRIERRPDGVWVTPVSGDAERFDEVIVACHADQALRLVRAPLAVERDLLARFPYQRNVATLHSDVRVLPRQRRAWASWNYRIPATEREQVSVTYDMNVLQRLAIPERYLVTLNDPGEIDASRVHAEIVYHHPLFQPGRGEAQARHAELIGLDGISYCGAYWGYGFHEDGVQSALRVIDRLEARDASSAPPDSPVARHSPEVVGRG